MTCGKGLMVVVAGVALTLACGAAAAAEDASRGVAALGWELVRASGDGDAIVSPVSVWEALAMTHAGARGTTAAEIATVLGMPDDREAIAAASEALRRACAEATMCVAACMTAGSRGAGSISRMAKPPVRRMASKQ